MTRIASPTAVTAGYTYETNGAGRSGTADVSLMPDPGDALATSGDLGAQMAALVVQTGRAQRKLADTVRASEEALQLKAEQDEIASMHREASAMRSGAWLSGAMTIGGAALEGAGSAVNAKAHSASNRALEMGSKAAGVASGATAVTRTVQGAWMEAGGKAMSGLGGSLAGLGQALVKDAETQTKHAAQRAGHHRDGADDAQRRMDDHQKLIDKATDFYREYLAARDQTALIAARRA